MTYRIGKTFTFDAAHQLAELPDGHKCARLHGHTYQVTFHLEGDRTDRHGFVMDYGDLAPIREWINATLDHRNLNDVAPVYTTAENLARWLHDTWQPAFPALVAVTVCETPSSYAEYRP